MPLEPGKIYQGDCLEQMREIADGSIDLVFADPPLILATSTTSMTIGGTTMLTSTGRKLGSSPFTAY